MVTEVYNFFSDRDYTHELCPATSTVEVYYRAMKYYIYDRLARHFYSHAKTFDTSYLEYFIACINIIITQGILAPDFPHHFLCEYIYNAISYSGILDKEPRTLAGYPHLHMAIFLNSSTSIIELAREILFLRTKIPDFFFDIDVGGKSKGGKMKRSLDAIDPQNDARIIGYTIKNCRYGNSIRRLERYPVELHTSHEKITEFYQYLMSISNVVFNGLNAKIQEEQFKLPRYIPPTIGMMPKSVLDIVSEEITTSDPAYLRPTQKDKKGLTHKIVNNFMCQKNLAVLYIPPEHPQYEVDGHRDIYAKHPQTKNTWYFWGKGTRLLEEIFSTQEGIQNISILLGGKSEIDSLLKYRTLVPTINIDFMWIELKDCFFHIQSNSFSESSHERPCFKHDHSLGKEELLKIVSGELIPTFTFGLLREQGILDENNLPVGEYDRNHALHVMYNIYRPRTLKDLQLALIGPTNCGKTSLLECLLAPFSTDKVGVISKGAHNLEVIMDKRALHLKEYDGRVDPSDFKSLLEGGGSTIAINPKHKSAVQYRVNIPVVISSNDMKWAIKREDGQQSFFSSSEPEIDPALLSRLKFIRFNTLKRIESCGKMAMYEEAMIFFFHMVKFYNGNKPFEYVNEGKMTRNLEYFDRMNEIDGYSNPFKA